MRSKSRIVNIAKKMIRIVFIVSMKLFAFCYSEKIESISTTKGKKMRNLTIQISLQPLFF